MCLSLVLVVASLTPVGLLLTAGLIFGASLRLRRTLIAEVSTTVAATIDASLERQDARLTRRLERQAATNSNKTEPQDDAARFFASAKAGEPWTP